MKHAQTIAMARDLLGDGRASDVVRMIDPLVESVDAPAANTGQLLLRSLRARVSVAHREDPAAALDLLPPRSAVADLCTCVRAEVSLWRGWAMALQHAEAGNAAEAYRHLDEAHELFESICDPSGRCWAQLGQALVLASIDEFGRLRHLLDDAASRVEALQDVQAQRWLHDLRIPACRAAGDYAEMETHVRALRAIGEDHENTQLRGTAAAHEARRRLDEGRSHDSILDAADTAEAFLRRADTTSARALLLSTQARVGVALRRGDTKGALDAVDRFTDTVSGTPSIRAAVDLLRARIALRDEAYDRAEELLDGLVTAPSLLPRGLSQAEMFRAYGVLHAHQDRPDEAETWLRRADRAAQESGHRPDQLRVLLSRVRSSVARGEPEAAESHLSAAAAFDDLDLLPLLSRRFAAEGMVAQAAGQTQNALWAYRQALSASRMVTDRPRSASLQLALAQLESDDRAQAFTSGAEATFEDIGATDQAEGAHAFRNDGFSLDSAKPLPYPPVDDASEVGALLSQVSSSFSVAADACLQSIAHYTDRWVALCRMSDDGTTSVVREHGTRPDTISPSLPSDSGDEGSTHWIRLRASSPLFLGIERQVSSDVMSRVESWVPVMGLALDRALTASSSLPRKAETASDEALVAESAAMQAVADQLRRLRPSHSPVLLTGESGTGKRRLAQALHAGSVRDEGPLVHVPAADLQQHPTEERLFGTVDDTGTLTPGAVHEADGGTLLVEDVDALSLSAQSALLHLLRTGEAVPANATDGAVVDVRLVTTTTADLDERIQNGHFRPALRDALHTITLAVPPLRKRRADIPLLVSHFLDTLRPEGVPLATVTQPAMEALLRYDWPGNVRQLRNEIERILVDVSNEPTPTVDTEVLLDRIVEAAQDQDPAPSSDNADVILHPNQSLSDVLSRTEKDVIERVLQACNGQVTASAEVLGLSRQGLYKKMKRLGIDASDYQSTEETPVSS